MKLSTALEITDDLFHGYAAMDRQLENIDRVLEAFEVLKANNRAYEVYAVYRTLPFLRDYATE